MEIDKSGNSRQHPINAHQFYTGQISDDATSHVKLHVASSGILTASITTGNDVIYIEVIHFHLKYMRIYKFVIQPASRFLKDSLESELMFVYNRSKIIPKETNNTERYFLCLYNLHCLIHYNFFLNFTAKI